MSVSKHTLSKVAFFRRELMKVYDKYNSDTVTRAFDILDQIESGEKSETLFRTVEGHLVAARRIQGIMA